MVSLIFGHFFLGGGEDVFLAMYLDLDIGYYEVMQILDLEIRSSQTRLTLSHYSKPHFFAQKFTEDFEFKKAPKLKDLRGLTLFENYSKCRI